jgi:hypothetical protein
VVLLSETQPDIGFVSLPVTNETFVSLVYGREFGLNERDIARQIVSLKRDNCHAAFTAKHGRYYSEAERDKQQKFLCVP